VPTRGFCRRRKVARAAGRTSCPIPRGHRIVHDGNAGASVLLAAKPRATRRLLLRPERPPTRLRRRGVEEWSSQDGRMVLARKNLHSHLCRAARAATKRSTMVGRRRFTIQIAKAEERRRIFRVLRGSSRKLRVRHRTSGWPNEQFRRRPYGRRPEKQSPRRAPVSRPLGIIWGGGASPARASRDRYW